MLNLNTTILLHENIIFAEKDNYTYFLVYQLHLWAMLLKQKVNNLSFFHFGHKMAFSQHQPLIQVQMLL